jgi:hypothetical protein
VLRLPTIAAQCLRSPNRRCANAPRTRGFLEALLQAEREEPEHRLMERVFAKRTAADEGVRNPKILAQQIHELAQVAYVGRSARAANRS